MAVRVGERRVGSNCCAASVRRMDRPVLAVVPVHALALVSMMANGFRQWFPSNTHCTASCLPLITYV